jgi:hypothetical protein
LHTGQTWVNESNSIRQGANTAPTRMAEDRALRSLTSPLVFRLLNGEALSAC